MAESDDDSFHSASEGLEDEFDTIDDVKTVELPKQEPEKPKEAEHSKRAIEKSVPKSSPTPSSDESTTVSLQKVEDLEKVDLPKKVHQKPKVEAMPEPKNEKEETIPKKETTESTNDGWDTFEGDEEEVEKDTPEDSTENDWDTWKTDFEPTTSVNTPKVALENPKMSATLPKATRSPKPTEDDWFADQLTEANTSKSPTKASSIWDWSGLNEVVSAVGEGFTTVVESSFGLPNAEEMARISVAERRKLLEEAQNIKEPEPSLSSDESIPSPDYTRSNSAVPVASFGGLFSGLVSGSLDVLETLGKKTFETLTVKDEANAAKRRFIFQSGEQQHLSDVLRELRSQEDEAVSTPSGARPHLGFGSTVMEKFNTNFVSLFEKSGGMVHLEGLELLSTGQEKQNSGLANSCEFDNLLANFCLEDVSECSSEDFELEFRKSIKGIGLPNKAENVISVNQDLTQELLSRQATVDAGEEIVVEAIHEAAICALAKLTAHAIQALHKFAQLILLEKPNMPFIFAFTYLICRRLSFFASKYANILSLTDSNENVDELVTNIFYECTNACHYLKKALELLRPFLFA